MTATTEKRLEYRVRNRARRHGCKVRVIVPGKYALTTLGNAPVIYGRLETTEAFLKEGDERQAS